MDDGLLQFSYQFLEILRYLHLKQPHPSQYNKGLFVCHKGLKLHLKKTKNTSDTVLKVFV